MEAPTLADFLQRALTWPNPNDPSGWVNLHWRMPNREGITGGQAFKTLEDTLSFIHWATLGKGRGKIADLYYCTSLQEEHGDKKPNGRYSAERSIDNAVSSRLLFADVDKYADKTAAVAAVKSFCELSESPFPTALVDSGGGIHAYWILPEPLQKSEWLELAGKFDGLLTQYDLKHDNISTDMARILRPPETFNFKRGTPEPVVLKLLNGDIDPALWQSLLNASPSPAGLKASQKSELPRLEVGNIFVDPATAAKGPAAIFSKIIPVEERVGEGTLNPTSIFQHCPMFRDTIDTGGEEVGQPVWHQQALAATFLLDGRKLFHELGCNHPGYSEQKSDEMYDRKLRDRASKGLGYPSCSSFEANGATQCKACPLRGKVTSPLNITGQLLLELVGPGAAPLQASKDERVELKAPFYYDADDANLIWYKPKKGTPEVVLMSKIFKAELVKDEKGPGIGMRVMGESDFGKRVSIVIPAAAFDNTIDVHRYMNKGGAATMANPSLTTKLMCSFRGRLMLEAAAQRAIPFGWVFKERAEGEKEQGEPIGFAYGGQVYYADGRVEKTHGGDTKLLDTYCITGVADPWFDALKVILDTQSAGLQCLTLSSFAAPLMYLTGHSGCAFMAVGESGGSKSSAAAVGVAVWARHKSAMLKPTSSNLAMMKRMGKIRHLVTVWDDVQKEFFDAIKPALVQITQGGEGLKLDQSREERQEGEWESMVVTTSNSSLAEFLEESQKNDSSGLVRCFEITLPSIEKGDPGFVDDDKMTPLFASLNDHHGHVGREYSRMLGGDPYGIKQILDKSLKKIKAQIEPYSMKERYWLATAQILYTAGILANQLLTMINQSKHQDLQFDLPKIEAYLVKTFLAMRQRTQDARVNTNVSGYAKKHLSGFINDWAGHREQMVWSNNMPAGRGRPGADSSPIFPVGMQLQRVRRVTVRWLIHDRIVRISKSALEVYCREHDLSLTQVLNGLKKFYKATIVERVTLAAGVPDISGGAAPETVIEIYIIENSWLSDILDRHTTSADMLKRTDPLPPEQNHDQPALRQKPRRGEPAGGTDAS
jgi:Domain of unknown function (DUF927)